MVVVFNVIHAHGHDGLVLATLMAGAMLLIALRRLAPKWPGFLIAVITASLLVYLLNFPVDTIGSRFGGVPSSLPMPQWPEITVARLQELLPSAFTIAFLAGVESLLSAMVADGMTGRRHRSNCELVAQGAPISLPRCLAECPPPGPSRAPPPISGPARVRPPPG